MHCAAKLGNRKDHLQKQGLIKPPYPSFGSSG